MELKEYLLNGQIDNLFSKLDNPKIYKNIDSYTLYYIINIAMKNTQYMDVLIKNSNEITNKLCCNFNLYDCLSFLLLRKNSIFKDKMASIYNESINKVFANETIFLLIKINSYISNQIANQGTFEESSIYNYIFNTLNTYDNQKSSKILYNLFLLLDFKKVLEKRYSIVSLMIDKYQKFDPDAVCSNLFLGSSIIGCLIKNNNQYLAQQYFDLLKQDKKCNDKHIKMIGGGSTSLVYKIGDSVLKLGETRNSKKIYIDFRILASQIRKLIVENGEELFYVEVMKYIKTGNVTKEECEELKNDLLSRGIIWEDAKPENCGILDNNDLNECNLLVDYINVAGKTDAPEAKRQFMKRKRKVVVLDNDNMRMNPKALWK